MTATPTTDEICRMTGTEQARLIRKKQLSPVEITQAVLDRIHALDPVLHAFCTLTEDSALQEARAAETAVMAGEPLGPLHGVPVSVKDLICTRGVRTMLGSEAYKDFVPEEDDVSVERLKAAGAVLLGKTNTAELGYGAVGHNNISPTTRNPWNIDKTPGGSSAGSAAAVAAGMGALTLGSDGGGSVRSPASFSGLFGMMPSFGRVPAYPGCRDPRYPGLSSWESTEHIGPLTRTVEDAALVLSVVSGPDMRDRHSLPGPEFDWFEVMRRDIRGKKIAYTPDFGGCRVDPEVRTLTADAAQVFAEEYGCELAEDAPDLSEFLDLHWMIILRDSDLVGMRALHRQGLIYMPHLRAAMEQSVTAEDLTEAAKMRQEVVNRMWRFMSRYDLFLCPTVAYPAFDIDTYGPSHIGGAPVESLSGGLPSLWPFNHTGQPAASVPCGWTSEGLPVGLQIAGRHLDDPLVMAASAAFEAARPWAHRWPGIVTAQEARA
ncbi:amidase [Salipiger abyssi]|uniref:amidase n=1 Tax=Salipiger abyssi TaxID=1250539 RepID=UPI004058DCC3